MKSYIAIAAGTVFISVLCSLIVPDGKLKKTVMFSLRMVCLASLISPVYSLFSSLPEGDEDVCDYAYISEVYSAQQSRVAEQAISNEFGENCNCDVTIEYKEGQFIQTAVDVETNSKNLQTISLIYEYLEGCGYININVK